MSNNSALIMRTNSGTCIVSPETKLFSDDRKIYISGEINDQMMIDFSQRIQVLLEEDNASPITLIIDSEGGEIKAGLAMYYMIIGIQTKVEVYIYCLSKAYSMAAILFSSGKNGNRFLLPCSEVMIHEPALSTRSGINGSMSTIKSITDSMERYKTTLDEILSKHTGKTIEEIALATSFNNYMTASEACDFGIADKIIGFEEMI